MTDIRLINVASLEGLWVDILFLQGDKQQLGYSSGEFAWHYFPQKFFGKFFFGKTYFTPPFTIITVSFTKVMRGSLDDTHELETAVMVALLSDALADRTEVLPDPDSTDRRGWWGNLDAEVIWDGWPIGCKNWLMTRAKITGAAAREGSTMTRIEDYTRTALQPFIDKRICSAIDVAVERTELDRIEVLVTIFRGPLESIELRFQNLWDEIEGE